MGCDIHLFIEYRHPGNDCWRNFGREFRLGRHYGIFASLANVRNYGDQIKAVDSPRGVPSDIGYWTRDKYHYYVCDKPSEGQQETTHEQADRWVGSGSSEWVGKNQVTDPDAHSGSWLSADEFEQAINFSLEGEVRQDRDDYRAVLAAMRSLETSGHAVRTVFWFDN